MLLGMVVWLRDKLVSFLEESPGVMSSTRLIAITLTVFVGVIVMTIREYVLKGDPSAAVITALAGVMIELILHGAVAIVKRNGGEG